MVVDRLLVRLGPSAVSAVVRTVQAWVARDAHRSVTIRRGDRELVLVAATPEQQEKIVEAFLATPMDESGRYALVVSSSRHSHPSLRPLSAPTEDARSLEELLRNRDVGAFHVRPIVDQPSWVVEMEVERFFRERRLSDLALLLPGHGIKDEDGALYFATMNTDPETLRSTTLSSEDVTAAMRRCRSRQQVIVLDCCYAGAFSKAMFEKGSERIGVQERFATGGAGRVVLAASDAMQIALEGGQVHGEQTISVFTRAFVEGIQSGAADRNGDGVVSLNELYDFVYEQVRKDNPEQTPTISNLEKKGDIVIALKRDAWIRVKYFRILELARWCVPPGDVRTPA